VVGWVVVGSMGGRMDGPSMQFDGTGRNGLSCDFMGAEDMGQYELGG
jgi:hypothetical protein